MSGVIVVIGAAGTVGVACVEALLRHGERVLATGRNITRLRRRLAHLSCERLSFAELDVQASTPWPAAVCACRRFIQCAGPSFVLTDRVLIQLLTHCPGPGVFIDPGGDAATIQRWQQPLAAAGWLGILGAGVQPGLVGVAIRALAARFPRPELLQVVTFTGGLQPLTCAGLAEYLQAVNNRTGYAGLCLQQGRWQRVVDVPPTPNDFPASARVHPFVDEEAACAAEDLSLLALCSFNVTDSTEITHLLNEMMVLGQIPASASQRIAQALEGKTPWFCLSAEEGTQRTVLSCIDSYQVTGAVAAWAMVNAHAQTPGASWFSQRPQSLAIWSHWQRQPPEGVRIIWHPPHNVLACEEGEI
ncbi:hypothetical protein Q5705_11705 [Kosakonia sp. H02]|nr:hypothetical protein Q5705_11705 [Kosakonia sp. H02]